MYIWFGTRQQLDKLDLLRPCPWNSLLLSSLPLSGTWGSSLTRSYLLLSTSPSCFYHLPHLPVVSPSLSASSTATLVYAFIVYRLDHCSSLYCGLPQVRLQPLDGILRTAARVIGGVPKFGHISEFMRDTLHWLPVRQRIHYRLSAIVWRCVLGIAPTYLLELFTLTSSCTGRQSLRSASRGDFVVPHARTAIKQHRAFSIVGPSAWNSLPSEIRSLISSKFSSNFALNLSKALKFTVLNQCSF